MVKSRVWLWYQDLASKFQKLKLLIDEPKVHGRVVRWLGDESIFAEVEPEGPAGMKKGSGGALPRGCQHNLRRRKQFRESPGGSLSDRLHTTIVMSLLSRRRRLATAGTTDITAESTVPRSKHAGRFARKGCSSHERRKPWVRSCLASRLLMYQREFESYNGRCCISNRLPSYEFYNFYVEQRNKWLTCRLSRD